MIISQTPLRMSILGGGTDLPEWCEKEFGHVVGSTIDKYIYVILTKRFDDKICVGYSKQETVDSIDEIQHDLVRESAKIVGMKNGFEIKTMADIPSGGSGLGSSSAILVGLLKIFYEYRNISVTSKEIAEQAFHIERDILKRPVGRQDHYFAALGGKNRFTFFDTDVFCEHVEIPSNNLYMFFTGITRKSTPILENQISNINKTTEIYYRNMANLAKSYVYSKNSLPGYIKTNWEYKKLLSKEIMNPEIEKMCKLADEGGANSYKILGAGGGGFLLIYCENEKLDSLRESLKNYRELPFKFTNYGTRVVFNNE